MLNICKDWVVVFQDLDTGKVNLDVFTERNELKARYCFWECYRHGRYTILTIFEKPEISSKS